MKRTKFYNVHQKLGAKIVEFAGYLMPIQYTSILNEHKAVRNTVGVFDVSHMGEVFISGDKALDFIQYLTINDASKLFPGRVQYSAMCYPDGGIIDDLLIYKLNNGQFMLVLNASNIEKDFNWMLQNNKYNVQIENKSEDYSLLAVQGPKSKEVVQRLCDKVLDLEYYHFFEAKIAGYDMLISRTGYTGEMGYELYFRGDENTAEDVWYKIMETGSEFNIQPIGLGARDTLRLEMGFCLYGNDIDQTTNPLEAGLGWITKLNKNDFISKEALLNVKTEGIKRKLVPLISDEKAFPRHGYDITADGNKIGSVTSGTMSPILDKPIALGYVDSKYSNLDTKINILIRGKEIPARIVKLPFVIK
jgi:aminomethyltransferase